MNYYNTVSSFRLLIFTIICYAIFVLIALKIAFCGYTNDYLKTNIIQIVNKKEYVIKLDVNQKKKKFNMILVTQNRIMSYKSDEFYVICLKDHMFKIIINNNNFYTPSKSDLIYLFPYIE